MVVKIHATGKSFKGLAAYLLHDKGRATTSDRVDWTETANLTTANPQTAWRLMAVTAMNAGRLKERAGVKASGRKAKGPVMHVSLSWDPKQDKKRPDREEMSAFSKRVVSALKADDRQVMVICHRDTKHPHLHLIINRVSPTDGRMLSSSNEKQVLSDLALAYTKETGSDACPQREINAARRKKGEYVRGKKDIPRPEFEAMRAALKAAVKEIPPHIAKQLEIAAQIKADIQARLRQNLDRIKEQMRPQWQGLYQLQRQNADQARQQKSSALERLRDWIKGKDKAASPALPFQRQNLKSLSWNDKALVAHQRAERAAFGRNYKIGVREMFGEIKTACQAAVQEIFRRPDQGGLAPQFGPAAAPGGISPALAQTPVQRRLTKLAEKFRKQGKPEPQPPAPARRPRDRERDREYEP